MDAPTTERQQIIDEEHLRLLSIGYYVAGGLHIAFASIFIIHFVLFLVLSLNPDIFPASEPGVGSPPDVFLRIATWVIGTIILLGWTFGAFTIYAGRCIKFRRRRTLSMVMAALNLFSIPFGTVVGICGLTVLSRPNVRRLYGL